MMNVLYIIIGGFILIFLEGFTVAFVGLRLLFLVFLFLYGKISWKLIVPSIVIYSLISDVIFNYPLGTNLLLVIIPFTILVLLGLFLNIQDGIVSHVIKFACLLIYFVLIKIIPSLLIDGALGIFTWSMLGTSILKAASSAVILYFLNKLGAGIRGEKGSSLIIRKKWN